MLTKLKSGKRIVGTKQVKRRLDGNDITTVFIAKDANNKELFDIIKSCSNKSIDVVYVDSKKHLGQLCNIDVNAAVAALIK